MTWPHAEVNFKINLEVYNMEYQTRYLMTGGRTRVSLSVHGNQYRKRSLKSGIHMKQNRHTFLHLVEPTGKHCQRVINKSTPLAFVRNAERTLSLTESISMPTIFFTPYYHNCHTQLALHHRSKRSLQAQY